MVPDCPHDDVWCDHTPPCLGLLWQVRLERARNSSLELQVEQVRKNMDETGDKLARKRDKKRRWVGVRLVVWGVLTVLFLAVFLTQPWDDLCSLSWDFLRF